MEIAPMPPWQPGSGTLVLPVNSGFQWIFLKDPKERKSGMSQQQVYEKLVAASARSET
ncbi:MAG: hypothetical protein WDN75_06720 [Bacteroidota bacterium]